MEKLYFGGMEALVIRGQIERGEPVTPEEMEALHEWETREARRRAQEQKDISDKPKREAQNRQDAIDKAMDKCCPFNYMKACLGELCAMFKVLEKPRVYGDGGDKHYDAMCGFNIPALNTKIDRS